jgi:hypothetical protein
MTDILEKLDNWETVYPEDANISDGELFQQAADEIRQLRTAVALLREVADGDLPRDT